MTLFIVVFLAVYGSLNLYAFLKMRNALSISLKPCLLLISVMAMMVFSPILVRVLEKAGLDGAAIILAYGGYTWMAGVLIFFVAGLCLDIIRLAVYGLGLLTGNNVTPIISAHGIYFVFCLCSALFVVVYGSFEARKITTEYVTISTDKVLPEGGRVRIAQVSDVHLGLMMGEDRLRKIIDAVQKAQPDLLVSTGDLVDGQLDRVEWSSRLFLSLHVPHGKFAVTGNHEFYAGIERSIEVTEMAGFKVLRNSSFAIPGVITVAGVDDEVGRGWVQGTSRGESEVCTALDHKQFTVLLKHRPVVQKGSPCSFDLQLSGHTHKGQIFPFGLITRAFFDSYYGLHELKGETHLYVSRGSGTWGPPIRFLAPPEVTIIDIVPKAHREEVHP